MIEEFENDVRLVSKKKPTFPVNEFLQMYLERYSRSTEIQVSYDDLLRFQGSIVVYDINDNDTLWVRCYYADHERMHIDGHLKRIYNILHSDGTDAQLENFNVDSVDYCTFGNTKPFRVKIRNILNDSFTYFYVKKADASRIYGLELEHLLSPHRITFLVHKDTLIEAHIAGIPGDDFMENHLENCTVNERTQIAKEFVKFNERCQIRLLGDMRSYNYVIIPTHDFDRVSYAIRAIDFDQQCYEGKLNVYRPQFFKENLKMVQNVTNRLSEVSIEQYKREERSLIAKRLINAGKRYKILLRCMKEDLISKEQNVHELKTSLLKLSNDVNFKYAKNMGAILQVALEFVKRNYNNHQH